MTNIDFNITNLEGTRFSVSIPHQQAIIQYNDILYNVYDTFGLDYLKNAICVETGIDPVNQQLWSSESELLHSTPLLPLKSETITLLIKTVARVHLPRATHQLPSMCGIYSIDYLRQSPYPPDNHVQAARYPSLYTICYLQPPDSYDLCCDIIGLDEFRNHLKLKLNTISPTYLSTSCWRITKHRLRLDKFPEYGWLLYNKKTMKLT
jgi:hypothetical protein